MSAEKNVIVIGAGVIGLSTALKIQDSILPRPSVTILARDLPGPFGTICPKEQINFTSPWGGAHNRLVPPTTPYLAREHELAKVTYYEMKSLAHEATLLDDEEDTEDEEGGRKDHGDSLKHGESGVMGLTFMQGVEYLEKPGEEYLKLGGVDTILHPENEWGDDQARRRNWRKKDETERRIQYALGLDKFRLLGKEEFPDEAVTWGCEYKTWCVNPMVYCSFLLNRFTYRGGGVVKGEVRSVEEAFERRDIVGDGKGKVDLVINCSGIGFGDPDVFPTRGQTCLVANGTKNTTTRQNADGSWTFSVPRNFEGGTVIGGTKEPSNWDPNPCPLVRRNLLLTFARTTYPKILGPGVTREMVAKMTDEEVLTGYRVLGDIVGRRPTRKGGMRLEVEKLGQDRTVVHAYGLGGRGYELSWGVAEEVKELVMVEWRLRRS